jgi:hypothetical protein
MDNRAPAMGIHRARAQLGIRRLRAQMGIRSRVSTNVQAPNTVGIERARAAQDGCSQNTGESEVQVTEDQLACLLGKERTDSDRTAPAIRPPRAARPRHPFPSHSTRRGPRAQPARARVQPKRVVLAKPRQGRPRPRRPGRPCQRCRELRRLQQRRRLQHLHSQHPRLRHPRRPRLRRQRRHHNSSADRTRCSPAARRTPHGILDTPAAAAPAGIQPQSPCPPVRSLP